MLMWAFLLNDVPQTTGRWAPAFHSPLLPSPSLLLQVWSATLQPLKYDQSYFQPPTCSGRDTVNPMLHLCSQSLLAVMFQGLLPLILESPCNGQFGIWFLICSRILLCNLYISGRNIFVHKEFCLQFPQKSLFYHCMGENWWIRVLWGICKVGELYEEILYVQWDVIYLCNNSYVSQKLNLHELTA